MRLGIAVGTLSALFVALFGSLNKRLVEHGDPLDGHRARTRRRHARADRARAADARSLLPALRRRRRSCSPDAHDAWLLLALALGCTLLPFTLSLVALRHMSAFAAQLAINLEPVYAIVLAIAAAGRTARADAAVLRSASRSSSARCSCYPLISRVQPLRHPEVLGTAEAKGAAE